MKLTDDFVQDVAPTESKSVRKCSDGHGLVLLVKASGKYWRLNYSFAGKRNTLALGVYPAVSLDEARMKCKNARALLTGGVDPSLHRKEAKRAVQGLRPRHPGALLRDVVLPGLSIPTESFADLLNLAVEHMEQLLNEHSPMTCPIALKLEQLLLVKAEIWMTMQQAVELWDARTELQRVKNFGTRLKLQDLALALAPATDDHQFNIVATSAAQMLNEMSVGKAAFGPNQAER